MTRATLARCAAVCAAFATTSFAAAAADWSDTHLGYRYGTKFAEPFNADDIRKHVVNLAHASGYAYGTNYFNVDVLLSDRRDPASAGSGDGAHEVYALYRHTLDLGKVGGRELKFGPVRGIGVTAGFDVNTKSDAGYNSKKRMLVLGPTLMFDVPGFLNASLLALWESNAPYSTFTGVQTRRHRYDTHPMLTLAWGIPLGTFGVPVSFEGYANFIASKGQDEFGGDTAPETNIDMQLMFDVSGWVGAAKNRFRVGLEYQYWRNKFGNDHEGPAGRGAFAKTPMLRAELHF